MRRYVWLAIIAICLCGATWTPERDAVKLTVAVVAPLPATSAPNSGGTNVTTGADVDVGVGSQIRMIFQISGYPKGVRVTITATAVK